MFKRFHVMDLFHADEDPIVKDWIDVNNQFPNETIGLFRVKLNDSSEINAYFFMDKASTLCLGMGIKSSYWWDKQSKKPIYNVTHWSTK